MPKRNIFESTLTKSLGRGGLSIVLGAIGGALCGAAILVFGGLIGRSGTTGTEYVGYWDSALIFLGIMYGGFFGVFVGLLAYPFAVRKVGIRRTVVPGFIGTLAGGFAGAIVGPPLAVVTGVLGFFAALYWARSKYSAVRTCNGQDGTTY